MARAPFWAKGIRFQCQGSGQCCLSRGSYGYVYLTLRDRQRLAKHFKLSTALFTRTYCVKTDGHFHLRHPEKDCEFLEGKQCRVYKARPTQCRTWPFWPENMSPKVWTTEIARFCPGIGKGRLYSQKEIARLLKQDPVG